MQIKFTGTRGFESYQGKVGRFKNGEEAVVPDKIGQELIKFFPKNFSEVKEESETKSTKAKDNKIVMPNKDK